MERRKTTSLTFTEPEVAERFREKRDQHGLSTSGMLRKLLNEDED